MHFLFYAVWEIAHRKQSTYSLIPPRSLQKHGWRKNPRGSVRRRPSRGMHFWRFLRQCRIFFSSRKKNTTTSWDFGSSSPVTRNKMASPPSFPFYVRTVKATWNFCSIRLLPSSLVLHSSLRAKNSPPPPFLLLRARCYQALKKSGETRILTNLLLLPTLAMPSPPFSFLRHRRRPGQFNQAGCGGGRRREGPEGGGWIGNKDSGTLFLIWTLLDRLDWRTDGLVVGDGDDFGCGRGRMEGGDCVRGKSSILAWFWRLADWVWRRVRPTDRPSSTGGDPPPWQNGPLTNQSFFFLFFYGFLSPSPPWGLRGLDEEGLFPPGGA